VLAGYRPYVSCVSPLGVIKIQRIAEAEDDPAGDAKPEASLIEVMLPLIAAL